MKLVTHINTKLNDTIGFRVVLVLCSIILIALREPALLLHPRLWAEEGCLFYQFALHHSLYEIFTTAHVGYLTFFNSIVSVLQAKIFLIERAAIVSTYMGFLVQLVPIYIIIFTRHKFWDSPLKKIVYILTVIVVAAPELWLNTTNSHFIFGLITFLIMVTPCVELPKLQKYFFRILLIVGGLTGPASMLFTPLFLLKAYREKSREKYIQAGIMSICALIQAYIIVYSVFYNNTYSRLSNHNYTRTLYYYFVDNFSMLPHTSTSYLHPIIFYVDLFWGLFMAALFMYLLVKTRRDIDCFISLASLLVVGTFSTLGSLNMAGSPRYAYIPTCIFMAIIIYEAFGADMLKIKLKLVTSVVLILCLAANIIYYRYGMRNVYEPSYPKWADEVIKWRIDKTYAPKIHPNKDAGQCVKM
ncbi:MAG TPA: hypothetical protein VK835_14615 [Bacteroidia bacterium]|nr:hypothetical protein [Bacteroidia bacterium]